MELPMISENTVKANAISQVAEEARIKPRNAAPLFRARLVDIFNRYLIYWTVPVVIVIVWQVSAQVGWIPTRILPAPLKVIQAAIKLASTGELLTDLLVSSGRALSGLLVGGSIGFLLGMSNGLFKLSEKLLDTTVQMVRTIPNLSLLPLVILWFGIGDSARLFLISLGVFFPIYINTFHGIRSVDPDLIEMGQVYGLSKWQLFRQVIFPGALPSILVGVRLSLGIMWLTLIVAETIAVESGIGYLAATAREFIRTDVLIFVVVLYAFLGKLSDVITRLLETRLLRWQKRYQTTLQPGTNKGVSYG
jgi:sulfonate transport system permease protein